MKGRDCIFEPPVTPDSKLDFNFFFFNRKGRKDAPFQTDVSNHFQNRTKFKFYSPGGTSPTPIATYEKMFDFFYGYVSDCVTAFIRSDKFIDL